MTRLVGFNDSLVFPLPKNKKAKTRYGHLNPGKGGQTSVGKGGGGAPYLTSSSALSGWQNALVIACPFGPVDPEKC